MARFLVIAWFLPWFCACTSIPPCAVYGEYVHAPASQLTQLLPPYRQLDAHRSAIGLTRGQLSSRISGPDDLPLVVYEVRYADMPTLERERAKLDDESISLEQAIQKIASVVTGRWACVDANEIAPPSRAGFIARNFYFPKAGNEAQVLAVRREASQVRTKLGVHHGLILKRDGGAPLPPVLWSSEILAMTPESTTAEHAANGDPSFVAIVRRMQPLLAHFGTGMWRIDPAF